MKIERSVSILNILVNGYQPTRMILVGYANNRNQTSYIYSKNVSKEIVLRIKKFYLSKLLELSKRISKASEKK
jgi:hypothetical protein